MPQNHATSLEDNTTRVSLRRLLLAQRQCIGAAERAQQEARLAQQLALYIADSHHSNTRVALYMPHAGEPSLLGLSRLISNPLCLPVMMGKDQPLQFAAWQAGDDLVKDHYGIDTPAKQVWTSPQLLLIPCLGYSKDGYRLGYGGGYYDRTLAWLRRDGADITAVGIAWRQAGCGLQPNEHDIRMDLIRFAE